MKLLNQRLSARDSDQKIAETQTRAATLNGFTAIGAPRTVVVAIKPPSDLQHEGDQTCQNDCNITLISTLKWRVKH